MRERVTTFTPFAALAGVLGLCCGLPVLFSLGVLGAVAGLSQRAQVADDAGDGADAVGTGQDRDTASTPGVVDLLARRRESQQPELRDDLDDVFARYYATHPDADGLEVFDE